MEAHTPISHDSQPAGGSPNEPTPLDRRLARPMFVLTVVSLVLMAGALHFGSEDAPASDPEPESGVALAAALTADLGVWCTWGLLAIYPLYLLESLFHWRSGAYRLRPHFWYCVLPPLRLGARDHASGESIWLPVLGWSVVDDALRRKVERGAHTPMLVIALLVLPLLVAQHYLSAHLQGNVWLTGAAEAGAALIWMAFTFEFIVMLAIAENRWTYARRHWLDLLIICFPLIAFLRFFRTWSLVRVLRLGRLQQAAQPAAKVFRLRGTMMRLWRAVLLLELLDRLFHNPEKRLAALRRRLVDREREVAELRREIARLESQLLESAPAEGI